MYSSFSFGSLPSSFATTFRESIVRSPLCNVIEAVTPSGTGLNSRVAACFFSASKSWPASFRRSFPRSSEIHPSMFTRPMFLSGVTRSNCSVTFDCTTSNG